MPFIYQVGYVRKKSILAPHFGPKSGQRLTGITFGLYPQETVITLSLQKDVDSSISGSHWLGKPLLKT